MHRWSMILAAVLLLLPLAPAGTAWTIQDGAFVEAHGGASGRRATTGTHPAGAKAAWVTEDLGDLDGPVLLTRDGQVMTWAITGVGRWDLILLDAGSGAVNARVSGVVEGCAAVAPDGTIWAQSDDETALLAIDPVDGSVLRTVAASPTRCEGTLQLLPGNRAALGESCCSERITLVDLDDGTSQTIPEEPVRSRLFLSSPDGARGYVVAAGRPLELLSVDLEDGRVLDRAELPGEGLGSNPLPRFVVLPGGLIVLVTDTATVALRDDGAGGLSVAWDVDATDDAGPTPATLYAIDDDIVAGWQAIGGADTLLGLDAVTGEVRFRTPAVPGASGGVASRSGLVDAEGNVILPQVISRSDDRVERLYDVFDRDGVPIGTSPPDLGDGVGGMALGSDGTLFLRTSRGEAEVVVAVRPGVAGLVDIPTRVTPDRVGAGYASVTVEGSAVARIDRLVLRRGSDIRRADPLAADGVPYRRTGRFDLNGAAPGDWEVAVEVDGIVEDTGEVVQVVAPDAKVALDLRLEMPAGVRNGRQGAVTLTVVNRSNVDGIGVPVVATVALRRDDPRQLIPAFDVDVEGDVPDRRAPQVVQAGNQTRVLIVALDHVPASASRRLPFVLDVPDDAPEAGEVVIRAAVPACHAEAGVTFDQAAPDPCIANAVRGAGEGAIGSVSPGTRNCLAMGLGGLVTPTLNPDGSISVPGRPGGADVSGVVRDCLQGAIIEAGGSGFGPLAVLQYEGLLHNIAIGYLDCRLGEAMAGSGSGSGGSGTGGGTGLGPGIGSGRTTTGTSVDPNEVQGPPGAGEARWVSTDDPFGYRILFENLPGAAFAAQSVTITTELPDGLDADTLTFGGVGFGGTSYELPAGPGTTLLTPGGADHRVLVTTERDGVRLTWRLETLSLTAAGPPTDDTIGFLPPNDTPPAGDGHVDFAVEADAPDGTTIEASAAIVFDTNDPILTNVWANTIDRTPPLTTLDPGPTASSPSNTVALGWSATDATSGVARSLVRVTGEDGTGQDGTGSDGTGSGSSVRTLAVDAGRAMTSVTGAREAVLTVEVRTEDGAGNLEPDAATQVVTIARDALDRLAGPTRIHTAVAVAEAVFPLAPVAVLARADTYPDSLAGSTIAHALGAPILLTDRDTLPDVVRDALLALDVGSVVVLGGTAAVSDTVLAQLADLGINAQRIAGSTRYGTAGAVAAQLPTPPDRAFVTEGGNADPRLGWPEALVTAPWAAQAGVPLLLVEADRLPEETAQAITDLGVPRVTIVGGPDRVSPSVEAALADLGVAVDRIGEDDRYATSLAVADAAAAEGYASPAATWVATGEVFADALAAGAAAAATGGRLLLVHAEDPSVSGPVLDALADGEADIRVLRIAGGPAAVGPPVEAALRAALR